MRKILSLFSGLLLCGLMVTAVQAETYQMADGTSLTGSIVASNEKGVTLKVDDNNFPVVEWSKFSQDDLKKFSSDRKLADFVEPYIEETTQKTEVTYKTVTGLERPSKKSLVAAMLSSSVGLVVILLLYMANIYAGYEIAIFRGQEPAVVCGLAVVVPVIGPIIFLSMPTKTREQAPTVAQEVIASHSQKFSVPEEQLSPEEQQPTSSLHIAKLGHSESAAPGTQVFPRGQFMFNRRFFETKFPGFFGMVRRAEDRDMVLFFKTTRGDHVGQRISRITQADLHLQGLNGVEVMIQFTEIQEVQLKHNA